MSRSPRLLAAIAAAAAAAVALLLPTPAFADNPAVSIVTPTAGAGLDTAGLDVGVPLLITGHAFNGESGGIVSVEITFDAGSNWEQVDGLETWAYLATPVQTGALTFQVRSSTASMVGNPSPPRTVHVGSAGSPPSLQCSCFFSLPSLPDRPVINDPDQEAVELGMRIRLDRNGYLTDLSIRRGTYTGVLLARVWSGGGTLLAEKASATSSSLFQRVIFDSPVPVQAGEDYVVSYYTPAGGYAATENYFTGTVVSAPFAAVHGGPAGAGVYHYGVGGGFPADTWHDSNYWVHPRFSTSP